MFKKRVNGIVVDVGMSEVTLKLRTGLIKHYTFWMSSCPNLAKLVKEGDYVEIEYRGLDNSTFLSLRVGE